MAFRPTQTPADLDVVGLQKYVNEQLLKLQRALAGVDLTIEDIQTLLGGKRDTLTANRTYYVRTDGNNNNDGLSNTSGGAFLTIQKAVDVVASLDTSIYQVTVEVANGTYAGGVVFKPTVGALRPIIQGNLVTPSSAVISAVNTSPVYGDGAGSWQIQGFRLTNSGTAGALLKAVNGTRIYFKNLEFHTSTDIHIWPQGPGAAAIAVGNYSITATPGGNSIHIYPTSGGYASAIGVTVTIPVALALLNFFAGASRAGVLEFYGSSFTGAGVAGTTGARYNANLNGVIYTSAGAAFFPGSIAGGTTSGGQYS